MAYFCYPFTVEMFYTQEDEGVFPCYSEILWSHCSHHAVCPLGDERTEGIVSCSTEVHPVTTQPLDTSCVCPAQEPISIFMDSLMLPCFQAVGSFIWLENYLHLGLSLFKPGVQGCVAVPGVLHGALGCCSRRTRQLFCTQVKLCAESYICRRAQ